jgi:O-antigen ligase
MGIKKEKIRNINLIVVFFLAFSGYYAALIVLNNLAPGSETRNLTIPLRLIVVTCIGFIFLLRPRIKWQKGLVFFLLFALAYLTRILIEYFYHESIFHITETEFFLYFTSFVLIPLFLISQLHLSDNNYNKIFLAVMASTLVLSVLTLYFYYELIGTVTRISSVIKRGQNFISPLALSYSSALGIGGGIAYLMTNTVGGLKKLLIYTTIALSFAPFYLGASRGGVLALSLSLVFYFLFAQGVKRRAILIISIGILSIIFIVLTEYLGSGVFARLADLRQSIEFGEEGRIDLWRYSFIQFLDDPIFGNSLEAEFIGLYPHNMLLEVLITTGLIGFIPFLLFLFNVLYKARLIIKKHNEYSWMVFIFLQAFTQNMFSGGLYSAGWFAIGSGLILGFQFDKFEKQKTIWR